MAILYGTQSNGETLPVLVDQFGNLIAKGIEGQPGTPGEPGSPGPPGPPGVGQLPPDPFEGAVLGWQDNELAWLGGSVPLPAGTYGPYTYNSAQEQLNIPQDASSLVNGQQLYMSDSKGNLTNVAYLTDTIASVAGNVLTFPTANNFDKFEVGDAVQSTKDWNQDEVWSDIVTISSGGVNSSFPLIQGFNGSTSNRTEGSKNGEYLEIPISATIASGGVRVYASVGSSGPMVITLFNGATQVDKVTSSSGDWHAPNTYAGAITKIRIERTDRPWEFNAVEVNGDFLVDKFVPDPDAILITAIDDTVPSVTVNGGSWSGSDGSGSGGPTYLETEWSGAGSVFTGFDGGIILRNSNQEWATDFYVTAPEQEIAARKVAANARKLRKK